MMPDHPRGNSIRTIPEEFPEKHTLWDFPREAPIEELCEAP